jgi:hypothetical protein
MYERSLLDEPIDRVGHSPAVRFRVLSAISGRPTYRNACRKAAAPNLCKRAGNLSLDVPVLMDDLGLLPAGNTYIGKLL